MDLCPLLLFHNPITPSITPSITTSIASSITPSITTSITTSTTSSFPLFYYSTKTKLTGNKFVTREFFVVIFN